MRRVRVRANTQITSNAAVSTLLKANADAGTVRHDLNPETVLRGLAGLLYLNPGEDWREQTAALTDLLWCGMGKKP